MKSRFRIICLVLSLAFNLYANAQKDYARKVVDTLASPYMAGRGYVDNGCEKAAKYIKEQFKSFGLSQFDKSYAQEFHFPISTYPDKIEVETNGKKAANGADYIVVPSTPSIEGTFSVIKFNRLILKDSNKLKEFLSKDYSKTFILVDDSGVTDKREEQLWESTRFNPFKAKGIIILTDKLTEETSDTVLNYALIYALRNTDFREANRITLNIKNKFIKDFTAENLVGCVKGSTQPDTFLVFSAHYDHLGRMGDIYFPGANDNASGVAMLLSLAKYYSQAKNQPRYSIAFIAFGAEEVDIKGSQYYCQHPLFPLSQVKFLVNMDIMGTGDEGIMVVNGFEYNKPFKDMTRINDSLHLLKEIKPRSATANSDHYFFYKQHVPDFFIYTMGGIKAYHDIYDKRETLPLTDFDNVFKLLLNFTDDICKRRF
jgi:aminopeptidase YwaD